MNTHGALQVGIAMAQRVSEGYLGDLTDADLMVRAVPGANHIAWQLGHLINSEHNMLELIRQGAMPELPPGFAEQHAKGTATSDDANSFLSKEQYLNLMKAQRAGTLALLDQMSDTDFDAPAPEPLRGFLKTIGETFSMQGSHWMMHAGQWALVRRKLGKPPLF